MLCAYIVLCINLFHGDIALFTFQSAHRNANLSGGSHKHFVHARLLGRFGRAHNYSRLHHAGSRPAEGMQQATISKVKPSDWEMAWQLLNHFGRSYALCWSAGLRPQQHSSVNSYNMFFPLWWTRWKGLKRARRGLSPFCFVNPKDTWAVTQNPSWVMLSNYLYCTRFHSLGNILTWPIIGFSWFLMCANYCAVYFIIY